MFGSLRCERDLLSKSPTRQDFPGRRNVPGHYGRLAARRIHGHSGSNQARREKARKAIRQATAPIERNTSGSESFGRFDQPGTKGRKEARLICSCESEDFEGNKSAVGKV